MADSHNLLRENSFQVRLESAMNSDSVFDFLKEVGVDVAKDLIAVQGLPGKTWDITCKTVEIRRRLWAEVSTRESCIASMYPGSATVVNVLHVPHELNDNVVRYVLARYGKVLSGRFKTYEKYPDLFNGIRQYQMELTADIPSSLRLGGRNCWIRYYGQPRTCMKCGSTGHEAKECAKVVCFKCQELNMVCIKMICL